MPKKKRPRYFLVFYKAKTHNNAMIMGDGAFESTEGKYFNRTELMENIKSTFLEYAEVRITNIIELNESDYNDWTKTEEL